MQWADAVQEELNTLKPLTIKAGPALSQRLISLIDYTSLNSTDTDATVSALIAKANTLWGPVAAVCIYPQFVPLAAAQLAGTPIKLATVANFPEGTQPLEDVLIEINRAIEGGAQEIDVVFPYPRYLAGEQQYAHTFVAACKAACGTDALLKVILETGALKESTIIADACYEVLTAGADFIKTSTGKINEGATLEAVATMLMVIRHLTPQLKRRIGLKVSGGIKEPLQAAQYVALSDQIMGIDWVKATTFRIGASKLVDELLK